MAVQRMGILATGHLIERFGLQNAVILIAFALQSSAVGILSLRAFHTMKRSTETMEKIFGTSLSPSGSSRYGQGSASNRLSSISDSSLVLESAIRLIVHSKR